MKRILLLLLFCTLPAINGCAGGSNTNAPKNTALNMAGAWTVSTISTQGYKSFSGTAAVTQIGPGLGMDGTTTLSAPLAQIAVSQAGTALTGTITNSLHQATSFNFTGTLSGGNFTVSGSTTCSGTTDSQFTTITGTITSTGMQGSYTIVRGPNCALHGDAGTFVATKQ